jgi:CIC family chloride channel protein
MRHPIQSREQRLILDAVLLGLVGAACAIAFVWLLQQVTDLVAKGPAALWWIPLATTAGGLVSGLLVYGLCPEAEGHGTDTVVHAFHRSGGRLRARAPFVKMIASALTIGSGGSAGREGPTALITAGIGSIYASLVERTEEEQRIVGLMAMAAGLSAVFRSPIGTAVFAVEVLYSDMEIEARPLVYTLIAAVVAYAATGMMSGWGALFSVPATLAVTDSAYYAWYAVLGVAAGLVASAIPSIFYGTRDAFARIPIPRGLKPALGGLGVGLIALFLPQVLGGGYPWIQSAIDGKLALEVLAMLIVAKTVALSLTIGSGGSGGVFAPTLFVGSMLGALLARLLDQPTAAFAVVGMGAVFAGAARVPLASLLMVTEMTAGYHLLAPAGLAVGISYLLQRSLTRARRYPTLYEAQVRGLSDSPVHHDELLLQAAHLLAQRDVRIPDSIEPLDLVALLHAGVPVHLPGGQFLALVTVSEKCAQLGTPFPKLAEAVPQARIAGVLRGDRLLAPEPRLALEPGDALLVGGGAAAHKALRTLLAPAVEGERRAAGGKPPERSAR